MKQQLKETLYVYPTKKRSYRKVTITPNCRKNLGIIEEDGHLNVKPELKAMIAAAEGNFSKAPGYTVTVGGATHGVSGVGYDSYAKFPSVAAAIDYLKKILQCPVSRVQLISVIINSTFLKYASIGLSGIALLALKGVALASRRCFFRGDIARPDPLFGHLLGRSGSALQRALSGRRREQPRPRVYPHPDPAHSSGPHGHQGRIPRRCGFLMLGRIVLHDGLRHSHGRRQVGLVMAR